MSIEVMSLVFKRSLGSVTRKAVLLAMADAANDDGSGIWKSAETIAAQCDLSKRTVFRTWKELEDDQLIRRVAVRAVRGGEVIIWGIDTRAVAALPRASENSSKPDDNLSPGDTVSGSDRKSPGDNDATDPVTMTPQPGDTVSPKSSLTHPIEPSNASVRATVDEILALLPRSKVRMAPRDSLPKVVKTILRTTPPESLLAAVKACYEFERHREEEGQYAPAIYTFLQKGAWRGWLPGEASERPADMSEDEWKTAMRHWVDTGEWLVADVSPAPDQPGCRAPAKMLRHAAKLDPTHADQILANLKLGAAA